MGLDDLTPFDPAQKIVEYKYRGAAKGLSGMRLTEFADELSTDSPAPGGGSVAALCGSLSASLTAMVAALTWSKKGMQEARPEMQEIGTRAQALKDWFTMAVDLDTEAVHHVLAEVPVVVTPGFVGHDDRGDPGPAGRPADAGHDLPHQ